MRGIRRLKKYLWEGPYRFFKIVLPKPVKKKLVYSAVYIGHSVGIITGKTKNYELWLIIQFLLYSIRPLTLVEFGAGRSTNYLAEYAFKYGARLLSFEQHLFYAYKINLGLKLLFLPWGAVKYAPLKNGWYDVRCVQKSLSQFDNIEFLFYDGPTRITSEDRSSENFYKYIVPKLGKVKMVVIDDVHRDQENRVASYLAKNLGLKRFDLKSINTNILSILLSEDYVKEIERLPASLRNLFKEVGMKP